MLRPPALSTRRRSRKILSLKIRSLIERQLGEIRRTVGGLEGVL
jgi:hypothetical protein